MIGVQFAQMPPQVAAARFANAAGALPGAVSRAVAQALSIYVAAARASAPVGTHYDRHGRAARGGALSRSISFRTYPSALARSGTNAVLGIAFSEAEYSRFVIRGARGRLRVKSAGRYVFFWPKIDRLFAARKVNWPGFRANPFHAAAYNSVESDMRRILSQTPIRNIRISLFA